MGRPVRQFTLIALAACSFSSAALAGPWEHLGKVQRVEKLRDGVELTAGAAKVRITSFCPGVIRIRLAPQGTFAKDASWAIIQPAAPAPLVFAEDQSEIRLTSPAVTVVVGKEPLLIRFTDGKGNVTVADETSRPMASDGRRVRTWKKLPEEEAFYGL